MSEDEKITRRDFVKKAALVGGTFIIGPTILSACGLKSSGGSSAPAGGSSAGTTASARNTIRMGILEPYSGTYAVSGDAERNGALVAIDEFNAKGGVWGTHKVEHLTEDAQSKPNIGAEKARKLVEKEGVDILIGGVSSGVGLAISAYAQEAGIPYIGSGVHADEITGSQANKLCFRTTMTSTMPARAVGKSLLNKGKKWYFLTADYAWGVSNEVAFKKVLQEAGGQEVGTDRTPLGNQDFSAQLTKAKSSGADVMVMSLYGADLISAMKQFRQFGLQDLMFVGGPLNGAEMAAGLSDEENIGYWGMPWVVDNGSQEALKFAETIKTKFNQNVNWRHWAGYNAAIVALLGIEQAGTTDSKKVVEVLESLKWDGLKPKQLYMRGWDHQAMQEVYVGEGIPKAQWKFEGQYFKRIDTVNGEDVARTKEENKEGAERIQSQTIPQRANYTPVAKG